MQFDTALNSWKLKAIKVINYFLLNPTIVMNTLSSIDYRNIGILTHQLAPDFALRMLQSIEGIQPLKTDITEIPDLFTKFCKLKGIASIDSATRTKKEYVYLRLVFLAIIIKLYNPDLISLSQTKMKRRLCIQLSKVLKTHRTWISQSVGTVLVRLNVYEDFKNDVILSMNAITK